MLEVLQSVIVFASAGSVLVIGIVTLRWTASFEARLRRIDSFLDRVECGTNTKRDSE